MRRWKRVNKTTRKPLSLNDDDDDPYLSQRIRLLAVCLLGKALLRKRKLPLILLCVRVFFPFPSQRLCRLPEASSRTVNHLVETYI